MSTKLTFLFGEADGVGYTVYRDLADRRDTVYLEFERVDYRTTRDSVAIELPHAVWIRIRQIDASDEGDDE